MFDVQHGTAPVYLTELRGLCDVSVTGAWGRIDDSVTAGGLRGACSRA